MSHRPRLAILASGTGTNAHAIVDAVKDGRIAADAVLVASDRPGAPVLASMRDRAVPVLVVDPAGFEDRASYERQLVAQLVASGADLVVLAGYMRICGPTFLAAFGGRTFNIHPSLLPAFPGLDAIGQALAAGVAETGVTVHFIDEGVDTGPIVAQRPVQVLPGDTRATLSARVHAVEHALYPSIVAEFVASRFPAPVPAAVDTVVTSHHERALEPIA